MNAGAIWDSSPKMAHTFNATHTHTRTQKQTQILTMCICISLSAYSTLFCLFGPKISIILFHPDKNVRKLTMNSAQYKRPFKAVSSMASVDGRNNTAGGTYNGQQTDGGSGGPMSTTSNVLNPGECSIQARADAFSGEQQQTKPPQPTSFRSCGFCCCCWSCLIFHWSCQRVRRQPGQRWLAQFNWRDCNPTCCWLALKRWLSQCCALGELGATTSAVLELDSFGPTKQTSNPAMADDDD